MSTSRISLANPAFAGRFRDFGRGSHFAAPRSTQLVQPRVISDVFATPKKPRKQIANFKPALQRQARSQVLQRNVAVRPTVKRQKAKKPNSQKMAMAMATLVFMAGLSVAVLGLQTNKHVAAQVQAVAQKTQDSDDSVPTEDKPSESAVRNYSVDPTLPRYVRIAKLGVFARVMRQGIDKKGALKAPGNIHNAGWYENSSKPGEGGAVLLDGHVAGPTASGVFNKIKDLDVGDKIEVERGDGKKFTYKVVTSEVSDASKTDMAKALISAVEGKAGLNLITCTGKFNANTGNYAQRITVFAVQI